MDFLRKLLLILPFTILAGTANSEDFCDSTDGLSELKALLTCQEDTNIASCAGIFTKAGGRPESERGSSRAKKILAHNQSALASALARKLHAVWRRPRLLLHPEARLAELEAKIAAIQGAWGRYYERQQLIEQAKALREAIAKAKDNHESVFEPEVRVIGKRTLDIANLSYEKLPPEYLRLNRKYARDMLNKYDQARPNSDQGYMLSILAQKAKDPLKDILLEGFSNASSEAGHGLIQVEIAALKETLAEFIGGVGGSSTLAELGLTTSNLIGFLAVAVRQITNATPVFCDEGALMNIEKSPWVEGCRTVKEINQSVIRFLDLPQSWQLTYLKSNSWGLCPFYKALHEKLVVQSQPRFISLECKQNKFILKTQMHDGSQIGHHVLYYPGTQDIRQINTVPITPSPQLFVTPLEMTPKGDVKWLNGRSNLLSKTVNAVRMYIMDAYDCCTSVEPDYRQQCNALYNQQPAPSRANSVSF